MRRVLAHNVTGIVFYFSGFAWNCFDLRCRHAMQLVALCASFSADPRFEGGGGSSKLNYDIFRKAYGFLGEYQDSEIEELKKSLKKEKNQVRCDVAPL